jgi:membrane-bound ClpP family serine protease
LLKLDANLAKELGIAHEIVDNVQEFYDLRGIKQLRDAELDFLYQFANFLKRAEVRVFLIMIGIACLILEFKMPGISLPGVIAALCFVLYFWAQSQHLSGQIIMLAIMLFVLGLILIALEIFVMPGFGVAGISGIILVVLSLTLATLEKKPETSHEWWNLGRTVGSVGIGLVGAVALAVLAAWYLPSIPYANRLVLKPPRDPHDFYEGDDARHAGHDALQLEAAALLGAIGVAATTLRPAGIARFGDAFVDVVTEGSYVIAGARIQVIEIEGNRVVVKEI